MSNAARAISVALLLVACHEGSAIGKTYTMYDLADAMRAIESPACGPWGCTILFNPSFGMIVTGSSTTGCPPFDERCSPAIDSGASSTALSASCQLPQSDRE
jgi:hypothetical protein